MALSRRTRPRSAIAATTARPTTAVRVPEPDGRASARRAASESTARLGTTITAHVMGAGLPSSPWVLHLRFPQMGHRIAAAVSSQQRGVPHAQARSTSCYPRNARGWYHHLVVPQAEYQSFASSWHHPFGDCPRRAKYLLRRLGQEPTPEANSYGVGSRPCLQLREQVAHMALDRLLGEVETVADLAVDEARPRRAAGPRSRAPSEHAPARAGAARVGNSITSAPGSVEPRPSGSAGSARDNGSGFHHASRRPQDGIGGPARASLAGSHLLRGNRRTSCPSLASTRASTRLHRRPVVLGDRVPGRVARARRQHHVLAARSPRTARRARAAHPRVRSLRASVLNSTRCSPQPLEGVLEQQQLRLDVRAGAPRRGPQPRPADLDAPVLGHDS